MYYVRLFNQTENNMTWAAGVNYIVVSYKCNMCNLTIQESTEFLLCALDWHHCVCAQCDDSILFVLVRLNPIWFSKIVQISVPFFMMYVSKDRGSFS